jgi:hypothetical protein
VSPKLSFLHSAEQEIQGQLHKVFSVKGFALICSTGYEYNSYTPLCQLQAERSISAPESITRINVCKTEEDANECLEH